MLGATAILVRVIGDPGRQPQSESDTIALRWFTAARWITLVAGMGAVVAGRNALQAPAPLAPALVALLAFAISNLWLTWRARSSAGRDLQTVAPWLMCADVALLSWLLLRAGGVLNPASVFYLVEIVVAALVFGRRWTWIIAGLAVTGYAALFLAPTDDLRAAQVMHPEIALHMQGMWLAFALTAIVIGALVTRLLATIERRDREYARLRERSERAMRAASLATLAAGAAHELSTPLSTIAVAARELERTLADGPDRGLADARLIRAETTRCRDILDDLAGSSGQPTGEAPRALTLQAVLDDVLSRLAPDDRRRIVHEGDLGAQVTWPARPVIRAIANIVQNAIQASTDGSPVTIRCTADDDQVSCAVIDRGAGMRADEAARAGEPFQTTRPGGTGLGLFVARSTVEQLGGSFDLTSAPGAGTTVTLTLPRHAANAPSQLR